MRSNRIESTIFAHSSVFSFHCSRGDLRNSVKIPRRLPEPGEATKLWIFLIMSEIKQQHLMTKQQHLVNNLKALPNGRE